MGQFNSARAATITVNTVLDENDGSCSDGDCSLRDAVATAVSGDTISIPSGTYVLTLGELFVDKNLTFAGGTPAPILDGNGASRVMQLFGSFTVTLTNIVVTNGSGVDGGGIAIFGGTLNVVTSEIIGNSASSNGGGIYLGSAGTLNFVSGSISQNTAVLSGGGVYTMGGSIIQSGGTIESNSAATGGGVYVNLPEASYTLNEGFVEGNNATALETGGGGVYVAQGTATINGGQILNNTSLRGGGVQSANGQIFLNGGTVSGNQAQYGGGIYLTFSDSNLTQSGGVISGNSSLADDFGGGGVYAFQGSVEISGGLIEQNTAVFDGGGVNIRFGTFTLTGGNILNNQAGNRGGGIFADQSTVSITNLQLGNNAAASGGGLYLDTVGVLNLAQTAVFSNTATANGAGLLLRGSAQMTNATISSNQAQTAGGGLWTDSTSVALDNVTMSQNAAVTGGGILSSGAAVTIHNSLLAGNSATNGPNCSGSLTSNGYNLVQNSAGCTLSGDLTGNILGQDPLLEPLTLFGGLTYIHPLTGSSPAVDTGDPLDCPTIDQQGHPRPLDGDLDNTAVCDIGAFEYGIPLRIADVSVTEGDGGSVMANFLVTLDFASPVTVTVAYATSNQSAAAGVDYTAVSGTLTFSPGQVSRTVSVPVLGDLLDETDETFLVTLSNPVMAYLADSQGVGTILDNDPAPTISINDVTINEGDSGSKIATFTVTLSAPSGKTVTANYATANVNAVAGSDYTAVSGLLTFTPGQTSKTISVSVLGDLLDEVNETFVITLSSLQNATAGDLQGVGTIQDNDPLPSLSIDNAKILEGNGPPVTLQITVTLSAASGKTVTVNYATADLTAVAGRDYTAKSGTLTFSPGQTSKIISISVLGDTAAEGDEMLLVNLSAPGNATLSINQGIGTIVDDETQPPADAAITVYLPLTIR